MDISTDSQPTRRAISLPIFSSRSETKSLKRLAWEEEENLNVIP